MLAEEQRLLEDFELCKITPSAWTHETHLRVGILHLHKFGFLEGLCRLRSGIIILNKSQQVQNTGRSGYHETLTVFWCRLIWLVIERDAKRSSAEVQDLFLQSGLADKQVPLYFYSETRLNSVEARVLFLEPDLQELNKAWVDGHWNKL